LGVEVVEVEVLALGEAVAAVKNVQKLDLWVLRLNVQAVKILEEALEDPVVNPVGVASDENQILGKDWNNNLNILLANMVAYGMLSRNPSENINT